MNCDGTIAAIATPIGSAGIGIIRISGPRAFNVASLIFKSRNALSDAPSHTVHAGHIIESGNVLDQCLCTVFRSPTSYTGEDVVEISCHGNPTLLKKILNLCLASGARLAEPGEFTCRAFLNGKMDLAQAEAVAELISAQSDRLRRIALEQLEGRLSRYVRELGGKALALLAQLEANLDFAEEEVPILSRDVLESGVEELRVGVQKLLETASRGRLLREGIRVALAGKPNVGKSSLFNALLRFDRAIVTEIPGTTRDTLEEHVLMGDLPVTLTDTAGLRNGKDPVEAEGVQRARRAVQSADIVLFIADASVPLSPEDISAAAYAKDRKVILVFNKCDRLSVPFDRDGVPLALSGQFSQKPAAIVEVSALTGQGLDLLCREVTACAVAESDFLGDSGSTPTLVSSRHEDLLRQAFGSLENARKEIRSGGGDECVALDLRGALDRFNGITGDGVQDDVLREIFSRFCIGK